MANMNYSNGNQDNFASNSENQDSLFPALFFLSSSLHFLPVLSFFLLSFFLVLSLSLSLAGNPTCVSFQGTPFAE